MGLCRTCRWWSWHEKRAGLMKVMARYCISKENGCHWQSRRFHAKALIKAFQDILDNACACCIEASRCYSNEDHTSPKCSKMTYEQKVAIRTKAGMWVNWNDLIKK